MAPGKYERKRKKELDLDTTQEPRRKRDDDEEPGAEETHRRHRSRSPKKSSRHKQKRDASPREEGEDAEANVETLSIEETNKLRAKLGLAPLEMDDKTNTEPVEKEDGSGEKVFTEHGIEIVHKAPKNWSEEKRSKDIKDKLDTRKKQREVYSKVLKAKKTLGDESDEEISDTKKWVERNRKLEEEMRKAEQKAKHLDELDEAFGIGGLIQAEQQKRRTEMGRKKKEQALTGGLVVGHSVQDFAEGRETVLVLQDKGILDEGEDEVLINPNMLENEKHKLNVERRKKKDNYQPYGEEVDEFGQIKKQDILSKYDEGIDGEKEREIFRLDESGQYDLDKEAQELEARRRLMMMNKKFESLESTKYTLATEFYTEEEIISFRRPKKKSKNARKRKALKAEDLEAELMEETIEEKKAREAKLAARRAEREGKGVAEDKAQGGFRETMKETMDEREDGELIEEKREENVEEGKEKGKEEMKEEEKERKEEEAVPAPGKEKWKQAQANVNVDMLKSLAEKMKRTEEEEEEEEEQEEDEFPHVTNVAPIVIEDEAEDELEAVLSKARKLRQAEQMAEKERNGVMHEIKMEQDTSSDEEETGGKGAIVFDATSEKYKSIGGSYELSKASKNHVKMEVDEEEELTNEPSTSKSKRKRKKRKSESDSDMDDFSDFVRMDKKREESQRSEESQSDEEDIPTSDYTNILGEEKDVTKGVGAMLKLAGQKGYLESGERKKDEGKLKHLESKRFSKVEQGRYDIEDKTMRKLERMGTTGTGPTRPFPEKAEYTPKIEINYADQKGRILDPKEAFRVLSWKFHGKGPGKKQAEKHAAKVVKREKLKKMNSMDTPLGTLNKQLRKQEQLSTPYLVLSGRGDTQPLQKE